MAATLFATDHRYQLPQDPKVLRYIEQRTKGDRTRLECFGYKVYSQSDEDGIIAEIFRRIGAEHKTLIEFGCETGGENNTRYLVEQGWGGLWMEALPDWANAVRASGNAAIEEGRLKFIEAAVTRENINDLITSSGLKGEIDLLSIDIDGNDYHVFNAINVVQPRVVVLEYNPSYSAADEWIMPYNAAHRWENGSSHYGASLKAMDRLAKSKGYTLVGCSLFGVNGFFVRNDLVKNRFSGPFTPERFWNPLNYEMIVGYPVSAKTEVSWFGRLMGNLFRGGARKSA